MRIYLVSDIAKLLNVSKRYIQKEISAKHLKAKKLSSTIKSPYIISESNFKKYLLLKNKPNHLTVLSALNSAKETAL
jgi:hypothetical protein